ncbi:MAG TPA: SDR family oxidoreductase [Planctomycetaceae bacterium]|jgi:NAD(P)-dependent dehydrogenase (short-subunit alcohol dehydrogenase family)|nr:SDR family oxidoreductase [Planctomycetaceae bacterium]
MSNKPDQKVAFITGANKGLGLETGRGLGKLGYAVVLGSRDLGRGKAAADKLRSEGVADVEAFQFDVTNYDDHKKVARHIEERYGRLDVLVNNAGAQFEKADFASDFNTTSHCPIDALRNTFDTNFFAAVSLTQTLLPLIRKALAGRIVNVSSILGSLTLHSDPKSDIYNKKAFAYDASKTALNAFTVHLAQELRNTKIKVNSAHPGWVQTDMGGSAAPLGISEGGKTSIELATLPDDGPTGGYFHMGKKIPW